MVVSAPMKILALALPVVLAGCLVTKTKDDLHIQPEAVAKIEVGKTTKAELLEALGPPREIIRLLDSEAFVWRHTVSKGAGFFLLLLNLQRSDTQHDAVTVIVDRAGIVRAVGAKYDAERARYTSPWGD